MARRVGKHNFCMTARATVRRWMSGLGGMEGANDQCLDG
jgi:hypothetical protein